MLFEAQMVKSWSYRYAQWIMEILVEKREKKNQGSSNGAKDSSTMESDEAVADEA